MNKNVIWIIVVILVALGGWRILVPIVTLLGMVGGALYLVERVLGIKIFPKKESGG